MGFPETALRWFAGIIVAIVAYVVIGAISLLGIGLVVHGNHGSAYSALAGFAFAVGPALGIIAGALLAARIVPSPQKPMMMFVVTALVFIIVIANIGVDAYRMKPLGSDWTELAGITIGAFQIWRLKFSPRRPNCSF